MCRLLRLHRRLRLPAKPQVLKPSKTWVQTFYQSKKLTLKYRPPVNDSWQVQGARRRRPRRRHRRHPRKAPPHHHPGHQVRMIV